MNCINNNCLGYCISEVAGRLLEDFEKKKLQGRNRGATAHFLFLVVTQQVVSRQEGRGVCNRCAQQHATARARAHDLGATRATCFSWLQVATSILCRDMGGRKGGHDIGTG